MKICSTINKLRYSKRLFNYRVINWKHNRKHSTPHILLNTMEHLLYVDLFHFSKWNHRHHKTLNENEQNIYTIYIYAYFNTHTHIIQSDVVDWSRTYTYQPNDFRLVPRVMYSLWSTFRIDISTPHLAIDCILM